MTTPDGVVDGVLGPVVDNDGEKGGFGGDDGCPADPHGLCRELALEIGRARNAED